MNKIENFVPMEVENISILPIERRILTEIDLPTRIADANGYFGRINGLSEIIQRQTTWSRNITDFIRSPGEARIYTEARLVDMEIGGSRALIRTDINWNQVDNSGIQPLTNLQRIERGLSPLDRNGNPIELHHIGQRRDSPLAELTVDEHRRGGNFEILHPSSSSDVHTNGNNWDAERRQYWRDRANADVTRTQQISPIRVAHEAGMREGVASAMVTGAITTIDNMRGVLDGEITAQDAVVSIIRDTGTAATLSYGTGFVTTAISNATAGSAHKIIRTLGQAGVTSSVISFGIASYDSVIDFATGEISALELVDALAENVAGIYGAAKGAKIGGAIGSFLGPAGTVAGGIAGGVVGGMVGYLVAIEAYATVVDVLSQGVDALVEQTVIVGTSAAELLNTAVEAGQHVLDFVATNAPEALESVRTSLSSFANNLNVPTINFR